MKLPTTTHRYPLLILFLIAVLLVVFLLTRAGATQDLPTGCAATNHPDVCAASYAKCNMIGLDDACMAVARIDGDLGHDLMSEEMQAESQNIKSTEKDQFNVSNTSKQ